MVGLVFWPNNHGDERHNLVRSCFTLIVLWLEMLSVWSLLCPRRVSNYVNVYNELCRSTWDKGYTDIVSSGCTQLLIYFSKFSSICSHQRNCHSVGKLRPLNCPHCPQTFAAASALNKHIKIKHSKTRFYILKSLGTLELYTN